MTHRPTATGPDERDSGAERPRVSRLFVRIYFTVALTVLAFAVLAGIGVWFVTRAPSAQWRTTLSDAASDQVAAIEGALLATDDGRLQAILNHLEDQLKVDVHLAVHDFEAKRKGGRGRFGRPFAGPPERRGPPGKAGPAKGPWFDPAAAPHLGPGPGKRGRPPRRPQFRLISPSRGPDREALRASRRAARAAITDLRPDDLRRLHRGRVVVKNAPWTVSRLYWPHFVELPLEPTTQALEPVPTGRYAVLIFAERRRPRLRLVAGLFAFMAVLAVGIWPLVRHFTGRLSTLEMAAHRLASGQLDARAPLQQRGGPDEIDQLAHAFNSMADSIQRLVTGQRALLANVSHELRTPVARMRVLVEILDERVEGVEANPEAAKRIGVGLDELATDLDELERLISDLLTGGRLALGPDALDNGEVVELEDLCQRVAQRHEASYRADTSAMEVLGDALLLERLLANLLSNARRACPTGQLHIDCARRADIFLIAVEDEGPGVPERHRDSIFEPFTRLDDARDRDRGGVGLGLYLCRQIARAHGGDVIATGRADGRPGARFEVRLPRHAV